MIGEFINIKFAVEMFFALLVATILWVVMRLSWKKSVEIKSDYLKTPTNNVLIVLGLVIPILVALASYLYTKNPEGVYSFLLATIVLYFFVLLLAIWQTFSIISVASIGDTIKIKIPEDRKIIISMSWMYGFLVLGLIYFAIFFLCELESPSKTVKTGRKFTDFILLEKPEIEINQNKDQIIKAWGEPINYLDEEKNKLKYQSDNSIIFLDFDKNGILYKILKIRKGMGGNMNGTKFLDEIKRGISFDENVNDVVTMINILADERAKTNNRNIKDEDYGFAASILCIIFQPKPPKYQEDITILRKQFKGISVNANIQRRFKESMTSDLLKDKPIEDAIKLGIEKLFVAVFEPTY